MLQLQFDGDQGLRFLGLLGFAADDEPTPDEVLDKLVALKQEADRWRATVAGKTEAVAASLALSAAAARDPNIVIRDAQRRAAEAAGRSQGNPLLADAQRRAARNN